VRARAAPPLAVVHGGELGEGLVLCIKAIYVQYAVSK
jgi:hypothetical protein